MSILERPPRYTTTDSWSSQGAATDSGHPRDWLQGAAAIGGPAFFWAPTEASSITDSCSTEIPATGLGYAELFERSRRVAGALVELGRSPGQRLAYVPENGEQAIVLLFGAWWAGMEASPLDLPLTADSSAGFWSRLDHLIRQDADQLLCLPEDVANKWDERTGAEAIGNGRPCVLYQNLVDSERLSTPRLGDRHGPAVTLTGLSPGGEGTSIGYSFDELALAVMTATQQLSIERSDRFLSWLPPSELAGLTFLLTAMAGGQSLALLPTPLFMERPSLWPLAMSVQQSTVTCAPAKAFDVCSQRATESPTGLDLSSLRCAATTGGPISVDSRKAFADRFVENGFRPDAFQVSPEPIQLPRPIAEGSLAAGQLALWFLSQRDPASTAYNVPFGIDICSERDVDALDRAIAALLDRHPALRTVYPVRAGRPVRRVLDTVVPIERIDASGWNEGTLFDRLTEMAERPFDLANGPLLRAYLFERDRENATLLLVVHHINIDGTSILQLGQEMALLYASFLQSDVLPEVPRPALGFDDFVEHQRRRMEGPDAEVDRRYWNEKLAGSPSSAPLPTDYPRPGRRSERGVSLPVTLPKAAVDVARTCAGAHAATLFSVLLSVYSVALHRRFGLTDLTIASPVSGRVEPGFNAVVGYFVNTLPLRIRVDPKEAFAELVDQVQTTVLGALDHQQLPYSSIIEQLDLPRDPARLPLCEAMFQVQSHRPEGAIGDAVRASSEDEPVEFGGLKVRQRRVPLTTTQFDLMLDLTDFGDEVVGRFSCGADLFSVDTAQDLCEEFTTLVEDLCADTSIRCAEPDLTPGLAPDPIAGWNATTDEFPDLRVHEAIAAAAQATPSAIALSMGDETVTYSRLEEQTNRIARHLRDHGVGRDVLVGVAMDRSVALPTVLLSIMKAGGAYVPLDPTYPDERLRYIEQSAAPAVVIADSAYVDRCGSGSATTVLTTEAVRALADEPTMSSEPVDAGVQPEDLVYVIYTSGSTGRPKGAANTHAGLWNRLAWMQAEYGLDSTDCILHKTPYSFDVSVWELFWPLMTGARMAIARPGGHKDSSYLLEEIARSGVTTAHFVPSMLRAFLEEVATTRTSGASIPAETLRRVVCSGEALPYGVMERFLEALPGIELHNLYGPTEASIDVTAWQCEPNEERRVYIGRPIANTKIHILDEHGQPVAVGAEGELHIAGTGVGRGYHGRPDLTDDRFVPDPFAEAAGARLYRTGDVARWSEAGLIEYLGRNDDQIKINGFRIELGEIEAVAERMPEVERCVVAVRVLPSGANRLEAFLVGPAERVPQVSEVRRSLARELPDYMVPTEIVVRPTIPLTHNGKVDRQALLSADVDPIAGMDLTDEPSTEPAGVDERSSCPTNPSEVASVEADLIVLWQDLLGLPVSRDDNFFAVGGDSIRSLELRAAARRAGLDFEPEALFEHQSIAELAQVVSRVDADKLAADDAKQISPFGLLDAGSSWQIPDGVEDAFPASQLQLGMLYHGSMTTDSWAYHDCVSYALELDKPLQPDALDVALAQVVSRHPALRSAFDLEHPSQPMQLVHRTASIPLTVEDLSDLGVDEAEQRVQTYVDREQERRYALDQAPLFRVRAHLLPETTARLTVSFHHAILDGWSAASLLRELIHGYLTAIGVDGMPPLPDPPSQSPGLYAALEQEAAQAEDSRSYFAEILVDQTAARLPRWPDEYRNLGPGQRLTVDVDGSLVARLDALAAELSMPTKTLLLAAHMKVLSAHTGAPDVTTGRVLHGRPEVSGGEQILGLFLNTLPTRVDLSGQTFRSLAEDLARRERADHAHRRYPFVSLQRDAGAEPIFETAFNYVHFHLYQNVLVGKALRVVDYDVNENTNFTLLANFVRSPEDGLLSLQVEFDGRELAETQARRLAEDHVRVLSAMVDDVDAQVASVNLADPAEERARAIQRDVCPSADPVPLSVLFERQAARSPNAPAVSVGDHRLNYGRLDALASNLAAALIEGGAERGDVVACCAEPSFERTVAVLAILKAGCAYLPLDPVFPQRRLEAMLTDAQVRQAVVTDVLAESPFLSSVACFRVSVPPEALELSDKYPGVGHPGGLPGLVGLAKVADKVAPAGRLLALLDTPLVQAGVADVTDRSRTALAATGAAKASEWMRRQKRRSLPTSPEPSLAARARVDDAAYVMFTSGSTGRPKGIRMHHRPLHNLVRFQVARSDLEPGDKTAHYSAFSFDVSFQEMFSTWAHGGELVVIPEDARRDARRLVGILHVRKVARLFVPVTVLHQLAEVTEELGFSLPRLREINTAGEALVITDPVRSFFARHPDCRLDNQYGPTETHVATAGRLFGDPEHWPERPGIGRPLPGVMAHVLDEAMQPVPMGVPGELYLAGACVASGYHNNPTATAERFGRDPLADGHVPLYRTGDLVCSLPDGSLSYVGRRDDQVKIRGFRVELGDVEHALEQAAGGRLSAAAVVARPQPNRPQQLELAAYVVPRSGSEVDLDQLRREVERQLPGYMQPASLTELAEMPLTRSGKLDRLALPAPTRSTETTTQPYEAPTTELEVEVCALFQGVLDLEHLSVSHSFFDVGGDSLSAVRLMAQIQGRFNVDLPISQLLSAPTVRSLSKLIETPPTSAAGSLVALTPPAPDGERPPLFCVHPIGGNVLCYVPLARHLGPDQPCYALQARGLDGREKPYADLTEMAHAYAAAITMVQPEGPVHLAGWSFGGIVACEIARCLQARGRAVAEVLIIDTIATIERHYRPAQDDFFGMVAIELLGAHLDDVKVLRRVLGSPALTRAQRYERLVEVARERGLVPEGADAGRLEHIVAVIESNMEMFYGHTPRRFGGRLHLLRCDEKMPARLQQMHDAIGSAYEDPKNGWGTVSDDVQVTLVEGNHLTVVFEPHASELARIVRASIDRTLDTNQRSPIVLDANIKGIEL